jgi:tRNA modification GTPase
MTWSRALGLNERKQRVCLTIISHSLLFWNDTHSIQDADISLCVLSLPDLLKDSIQVPPTIQPFISSRTLVLFNKSDLVDSSERLNIGIGERSWTVSLHTGEGMTEFMDGFARAIQER